MSFSFTVSGMFWRLCEACNPSRAVRKCGSIWLLLTPTREGNVCCGTVSCVLVSWCVNYLHRLLQWIPGRELSCLLEKQQQQQQAIKNEISSVARIITWSWKCEEILKEPLQPKHSSADWFADRGQKNGAPVLISEGSLLPQDQRRTLFAESS